MNKIWRGLTILAEAFAVLNGFVEIPKVKVSAGIILGVLAIIFACFWVSEPGNSQNTDELEESKREVNSNYIRASGSSNTGSIAIKVMIVVIVGFVAFANPLYQLFSKESSSIEPPTETTASTELTLPTNGPDPGAIVTFGSYEQDGKQGNGKEAIEWLVLDTNGDKILLVSEKALDCQPYHSTRADVTWESCSLRQWLNGSFYDLAFNADEQKQIIFTEVVAERNPQFDTSVGENTMDKIFLLSIDETLKYLPTDSKRMCNPTPYAISQGAYINNDTGGSWWWLRTPGSSSKDAASVNSDGSIDYDDGKVSSGQGTVRPAMWISWA